MHEIDILKIFKDFFNPKEIFVFWDRTYEIDGNHQEYITLEFTGTEANVYSDDDFMTTTTGITLRYFYDRSLIEKKGYGYEYIAKIKKDITKLIRQNNLNLNAWGFDIGAVNNFNCIGFTFEYEELNL